jgi:PAS domain S-box-containing protein
MLERDGGRPIGIQGRRFGACAAMAAANSGLALAMLGWWAVGGATLASPPWEAAPLVLAILAALLNAAFGALCLMSARNDRAAGAAALDVPFREALAAARMDAFEWDPHTDRVERTLGKELVLGEDPTALGSTGREYFDRLHPDDRPAFMAALQSLTPERPELSLEYRLRAPSGRWLWFRDAARGVFRPDGTLFRVRGVTWNVTELRQARERADFLAGAIETSSQPFGVGAPDGRLVLFNRAFVELTGHTEEELRSASWATKLTPAEWREHEAKVLAELHRTGEPQLYEKEYVRKDGSRVPVEIKVHLLKGGDGELLYYAFVTDLTERRRAEQALRRSEAIHRRLAEANLFGVGFGDSRGEVTHVNDEMLRMMGRTREDFEAGRINWAECIAPEFREAIGREAERVLSEGQSSGYEAAFVRPDGGRTPYIAAAALVTPGEDLHVSIALDLTQVRSVEERLKASEERFRLMADSIDQMIWVARPDGHHEHFNRRWYEYTGVPEGSTDGEGWSGMFHRDDQERAWSRWRHSLATGEPYEIEYRLRHASGEYRWVLGRARPLRDAEGRIAKWFGTCTDIDEFKRTQEALAQSERQLQTLADNTPDILSRYDRGLRHLFVSAAIAKATGRNPEEFFGRTNRELGMPPGLCDLWDDAIRRAFEHGRPEEVEFRYDSPDRLRHFSSRFVPEFGPSGEVESVLGVTADVTERKLMEEALRDADRRKDEFLATLAHELRNPLAPIRNGLQILRAAGDAAATGEVREMMERQLAHMVRLIDDLLDVSRVSRGKIELKRERVTLRAVLDSAVEASRPLIESSGHELVIRAAGAPTWLDGDPTRLSQVVSNLLNNAAKYTPDGGRIELSARVESGLVAVRVRDDGTGIPGEMLPRIFDMFTQVDGTINRSQGGLGIGLSLVRKLAELHGGSIEAESPGEGLGSTFTVRLPAASPPGEPGEATPARRRSRRPVEGPTLRVLVVDDSEDSARSLAILMEMNGHETCVAHGGPEALEAVRAFLPDVVFLDIGMPGMDGYEACRRLRATDVGPRPTIVALTGWGADGDRERTRAAGFDHHLVKPVELDRVEALLKDLAGTVCRPQARAR